MPRTGPSSSVSAMAGRSYSLTIILTLIERNPVERPGQRSAGATRRWPARRPGRREARTKDGVVPFFMSQQRTRQGGPGRGLAVAKTDTAEQTDAMTSSTDTPAAPAGPAGLETVNKDLEGLNLSSSNSEDEDEAEGHTDGIDEELDEEERVQREQQQQKADKMAYIEKTYGLTTIPDTNVDVLPADQELTADIPLDTTYIDLIHLKIGSLENLRLERFTQLESINLRDNLIVRLNALKHIDPQCKLRIKELDFYDNRIKHISSHVNEFTNLEILDLSFNNIKHIKHVENLTRLENLYFVQNKISKIENLDRMTLLQNLELGGNRVETIENLDSLVSLRQLWLGQNRISRLEGLARLRNLRVLSIQSNRIEKIEGLDGLTALEELYLSNNRISKLEGLDALVNLQVLDVTSNAIAKLEGLDALTQLTDFWCSYNQVADYSNIHDALQHATSLETVYFEGNPIQLKDPTMYRTKLRLCFGDSLQKIDALYVSTGRMVGQ